MNDLVINTTVLILEGVGIAGFGSLGAYVCYSILRSGKK